VSVNNLWDRPIPPHPEGWGLLGQRVESVNSSRALKGGASLLLLRFCAVIALWHRGTLCGNFRFPFHWPKLTSGSRCRGSDLIGQVLGVPSQLYGIVWRIQNLPLREVIDHPSSTLKPAWNHILTMEGSVIRYIIDLCRAKVIRAKGSAFIPTLKDGDFPLRPSQSYELKRKEHMSAPHHHHFDIDLISITDILRRHNLVWCPAGHCILLHCQGRRT